MGRAIRLAVHDGAFCTLLACPHKKGGSEGTMGAFVDCTKKDCDNHRRGPVTLPKSSDEPPFALPTFETPLTPE